MRTEFEDALQKLLDEYNGTPSEDVASALELALMAVREQINEENE